MKSYIKEFCLFYSYPQEAAKALLSAYEQVENDTILNSVFNTTINNYSNQMDIDYNKVLEDIKSRCEELFISHYPYHLIIFICLSKYLKDRYIKAGLSEKMYIDAMADLKYKLIECHDVHGIWGSSVGSWFVWFFTLNRYALGRLQFEIIEFGDEYSSHGVNLTKVSKVVNCHIPSSGPLHHEDCLDSYRQAEVFFKKHFDGGIVLIVCNSWLLFPRHSEFLKPTSNILKFACDYEIINDRVDDKYRNMWRIFNMEFDGDFEKFPRDNSLRLSYYNFLKAGNLPGGARGILFIKDGKIIK